MRVIQFYRSETGQSPIEEFLDSLSGKQAKKIAWILQLIEELDNIPAQYFKKLVGTDNIWEVRVQVSGNIFRLLGFIDGNNLIILNHGFQKKTKKTPLKEIKTAEKRKKDYLSRRQV